MAKESDRLQSELANVDEQVRRTAFFERVGEMVGVLTTAEQFVLETARAQEAIESGGALAKIGRRFTGRFRGERAEVAGDEARRYGEALVERYAHLDTLGRTTLESVVKEVITRVPRTIRWDDLTQAATHGRTMRGIEPRHLGEFTRTRVAEALERITPGQVVLPGLNPPPATDSVLPDGARALAGGWADPKKFDAAIERSAAVEFSKQIDGKTNVEVAAAIRQLAGGDPLEALRIAPRVLGGKILLGTSLDPKMEENPDTKQLDPETRKPLGPSLADPTHSICVVGPSGLGKTLQAIATIGAQRAAMKDQVVTVTPHSGTVLDMLPTMHAVSGQKKRRILDLAGEVVSRESQDFCTWDPTRDCMTPAGAQKFAEAFAGKDIQASSGTANPLLWSGLMRDMFKTAGHITAGLRQQHGLDPAGLNGMMRVHDLLNEKELPTELPESVRKALASNPQELQRQEQVLAAATAYADDFHPRLREMAFQEHLLRAEGVPLDEELVGKGLRQLNDKIRAATNKSDPMTWVVGMFKEELTAHELEVMSPRTDTNEITPEDLVKPGAGSSFIVYGLTETSGAAAGILASQTIKAAVRINSDAGMMQRMEADVPVSRTALIVDEGNAARHIPNLADLVTDLRQKGVNLVLAVTSEEHLESVFGAGDAGKLRRAPVVMDLRPEDAKAALLAQHFGTHWVVRQTESQGPAGWSTSNTPVEDNIVKPKHLSELPLGQAVVVYNSAHTAGVHQIISLPWMGNPETLVGAAAKHVADHPEEFESVASIVATLRPDLAALLAVRRDPTAALAAGSEAAVADAIAQVSGGAASVVEAPEAAPGPIDAEPEGDTTEPAGADRETVVGEPAAEAPTHPVEEVNEDPASEESASPEEASAPDEPDAPGSVKAPQEPDPQDEIARLEELKARLEARITALSASIEPAKPPAETPAKPEVTEEPAETPAKPEVTEEPAETPAKPEVTEEPAETPAKPEVTEEPAETPAKPEVTEEPAETPAKPEVTEEPAETPAKPEVTEEPAETPAKPEVTEEPAETPAKPEVTEEPAEPPAETPATAEAAVAEDEDEDASDGGPRKRPRDLIDDLEASAVDEVFAVRDEDEQQPSGDVDEDEDPFGRL